MVRIERCTVKEIDYEVLEKKGSSIMADVVNSRYLKNKGVKCLFDRLNSKIINHLYKQRDAVQSKCLLDIGCGFGDFLITAQKDIRSVYGVDMLEQELVNATRYVGKDASVAVANAQRLPFKDGVFDFVVMKRVLHHIADPEMTLKEVRRVIKKGGKVVILDGNPSSWYRVSVLKIADLLGIDHESTLFRHLTYPEIRGILNNCNFDVQNIGASGFFTPLALLNFGKPGLWKVLHKLEDFFEHRLRWFMWYSLIVGTAK